MRVPQSVQAGFYYEPIEDLAFMGDVTWVDWSRFGRIELDVGDSSTTYKVNYDDIWIASIGTQYQFTDAWRGGLGFTYISSAVSNKHRSVGLPLDEYYVFGIGGYHQMLPKLGLNANLLAVFGGPGKVDQQGQRSGRLKGKFTRRQSFALQFSLVWGESPS
jgi:long-chain fatty acid transport protein